MNYKLLLIDKTFPSSFTLSMHTMFVDNTTGKTYRFFNRFNLHVYYPWSPLHIRGLMCPQLICQLRYDINSPPPPEQIGSHIADDKVKCIFMNENFCILIRIPLKYVSRGPIDNKPALGKITACAEYATSHYMNKSLTISRTHIRGTRGRWVRVTGFI